MEEIHFFSTIPVLKTENYQLRGVTDQDVNDLFAFMGNKETMKYITPNPVQSEAEMGVIIDTYLQNFANHKEIPWVIVDKTNGALVGLFRFHKLHLWHRKTEMGAIIRKAYQKKGVMTELLATILDFGFNKVGLNRIVGDIFADNEGSRRLMERYGFRLDGVLRQTDFDGESYHDTVVYSMLKDEYVTSFNR